MVFLIGGETHTGKTFLAQKLLEMHHFPYISLDHLKMGLIRGMNPAPFEVTEDSKIAEFLFGIVEGIIKTCLENSQNLIIDFYITSNGIYHFGIFYFKLHFLIDFA